MGRAWCAGARWARAGVGRSSASSRRQRAGAGWPRPAPSITLRRALPSSTRTRERPDGDDPRSDGPRRHSGVASAYPGSVAAARIASPEMLRESCLVRDVPCGPAATQTNGPPMFHVERAGRATNSHRAEMRRSVVGRVAGRWWPSRSDQRSRAAKGPAPRSPERSARVVCRIVRPAVRHQPAMSGPSTRRDREPGHRAGSERYQRGGDLGSSSRRAVDIPCRMTRPRSSKASEHGDVVGGVDVGSQTTRPGSRGAVRRARVGALDMAPSAPNGVERWLSSPVDICERSVGEPSTAIRSHALAVVPLSTGRWGETPRGPRRPRDWQPGGKRLSVPWGREVREGHRAEVTVASNAKGASGG